MLNDVDVLRACIPGCESITLAADGRYDVVMTASIGPVRTSFKGKIEIADVDAPRGYTLKFEGKGGPAGFARGEARVALAEAGRSETRLAYTAAVHIGGKLAQVGSRVIDAAAGAMADKFFAAFAAQAQGRGAPSSAAEAAAASVGPWALLKRFLARVLSYARRDRSREEVR
jgi:carbon monoxide dehydrogenase subunit G